LLFCQTALIPTHQFLPLSFHSPPHAGGGRGGRVVLLLPGGSQNQNKGTIQVVTFLKNRKIGRHTVT